ncbi:low-density lipoprotein receptor, putative [Ixodes scapularis]|uniref:Low-density lipoprotein receptor, putative n=1 Tax=Ixodes scapularis TaxID=6945 RepID=B7PY45_IXOSC|nr:low-density lipoprotein receptor, putative [Ixodes scapularis]|eukprot:XP_002402551.1 low-density lipoprotein receptor, putative [Ixodes scapularis]
MIMGGSVHTASRVSLESRRPTTASCLTFWWKGFGEASDLNVYKYTAETVLRDPIASVRTRQSSWWNVRSVTVSSRNNWMPVFEAVSAESVRQQSGIMLDDIEITTGACLPDSYYLLFKSTGDRADSALLMLRDQRYRCATLWYFLSKSDTGCRIRIGTEQRTNATKLWTRVQFGLKQGPIPVGIHVNCGRDKEAFAAIDDLMVDEKECWQLAQSTEVFNCGDAEKRSVPVDRVCNFVWDCPNGADEQNCGTCDFATDTCGWNVESGLNKGKQSWVRKRAGELEESPPVDWTGSSKGYYLLNHAGQLLQGHRGEAIAVAPTIRNTNYMCVLQFWYNYASERRQRTECSKGEFSCGNGVCIDERDVCNYVDNCGDGSDERNCADHNLGCNFDTSFCDWVPLVPRGDFRGFWQRALPVLYPNSGPTRDHTTGLPEGTLPAAPPAPVTTSAPVCPEGTFSCGGGTEECIPQSQVCDFKRQCSDGSDEAQCGACDFSQDMCGLTSRDPNSKYLWNRISTQDVAKGPNKELPIKDRNNNPQGFYVAYTNTNKDVPYRRNDLLTPILGRIAHSCIVSFYSFMKPKWVMTLRFGVEENDTSLMIPGLHKTFAEVEGHNTWTRSAVKVGNWNPGYRVRF